MVNLLDRFTKRITSNLQWNLTSSHSFSKHNFHNPLMKKSNRTESHATDKLFYFNLYIMFSSVLNIFISLQFIWKLNCFYLLLDFRYVCACLSPIRYTIQNTPYMGNSKEMLNNTIFNLCDPLYLLSNRRFMFLFMSWYSLCTVQHAIKCQWRRIM